MPSTQTQPSIEGTESVAEILNDPAQQSLANDIADASIAPNRGAILNILLVLLFGAGFLCFGVLYLEFWILDFSVLGDPAPVWAQTMWFAPQLVVVFISLGVFITGVKTNFLKAPSVHLVMVAFVALIFSTIGAVHYQGLFWQCEEHIGNMEEIETYICHHNRTQLRTIAWIAVVFVGHALVSIGVGVAVYSSDSGQFSTAVGYLSRGYGKVRGRFGSENAASRYSNPSESIDIGASSTKLNRRKTGRSSLSAWRSHV